MALLAELLFVSVVLTSVMFMSRQAMLGFACFIFWAITGGQAYTLSIDPWGDIYFFIYFGSFGMAMFTALAAFGLREKRDTFADEEMDEEEADKTEGVFDEEEKKLDKLFTTEGESLEPSERTKELRERAKKRRTGESRKKKR